MTKLIRLFLKPIFLLVFLMPRAFHRHLGNFIGILWFDILRIRRGLVLANIRLAYPEWNDDRIVMTARQAMCIVGRGIVDVVLIPFMSKSWVEKHVDFRGTEYYEVARQKARQRGTGVGFLSLHLASGDLAVAAMSISGFPIHLITKEFKSAWLNDFWFSARKKHGTRYISDRKSSFDILKALKKNEVVIFVLDQFMGPPIGTEVLFFGQKTGAAMGLAVIADRAECPILPCFSYYEENDKFVIELGPEIQFDRALDKNEMIKGMTQKYTDVLEAIIKKYPEQWMWVHRRWKEFKH
ncbi:MAG: lysophospholipid acyltransferase family protein [Pseudomonadota bacterium]|nr:lysophospholipid acyltransferase family protein [Pseudomonadota bacterium]